MLSFDTIYPHHVFEDIVTTVNMDWTVRVYTYKSKYLVLTRLVAVICINDIWI